MTCRICEILEKKNAKIVYEDAVAMAVMLIDNASTLGHIQVFPKKHVENIEDLDDGLVVQLFYIASYSASAIFEGIGAQGTNIMLNNGKGSKGSNTKHNHLVIDVIPRKENDNINLQWKPQQLKAEDFEAIKKKIKDKTDFINLKKEKIEEKKPVQLGTAPLETMGEEEENYLIKSLYRIP